MGLKSIFLKEYIPVTVEYWPQGQTRYAYRKTIDVKALREDQQSQINAVSKKLQLKLKNYTWYHNGQEILIIEK